MPAQKTERLEARITPETAVQIDDLSKLWGAVKPLSQSDVAAEAIRRAWEVEAKAKAKEKKRR